MDKDKEVDAKPPEVPAETEHQRPGTSQPTTMNPPSAIAASDGRSHGTSAKAEEKPAKPITLTVPAGVEYEMTTTLTEMRNGVGQNSSTTTGSRTISDIVARERSDKRRVRTQLRALDALRLLDIEQADRERAYLLKKHELEDCLLQPSRSGSKSSASRSESSVTSKASGISRNDDHHSRKRAVTVRRPGFNAAIANEPSMREWSKGHHIKLHDAERCTPAPAPKSAPGKLSSRQTAARHIWPKKLPSFSGDPEEWPVFSSQLREGNEVCGFSDAENLIRLSEALTGKARASVLMLLTHPSNVAEIVKTLEMLFGRPEMLIANMLNRVRKLEPPNLDNMETLINFGLGVRQLSATLVAAELESHQNNPLLLAELVNKLPGSLKLEWARMKKHWEHPSLREFGEFMSGLVEEASAVSSMCHQQKNPSNRNAARVNAHSLRANASSTDSSPPPPGQRERSKPPALAVRSPCPVCSETAHRMRSCPVFRELSLEGRQGVVRTKGLCPLCLNQHGTQACKLQLECDVAGCHEMHHPLLHPSMPAAPSAENAPSFNHHLATSEVLFRYLPVVVQGNGKRINCFAFLDDGSSVTMMDKVLADELNLSGENRPLCLGWTGGVQRWEEDSSIVTVSIAAPNGKSLVMAGVHTVDELQLPAQTLNMVELAQKYPHLKTVPMESYTNAQPQILIGLPHSYATITRKSREGRMGDPIAVKTPLGWTVSGGSDTSASRCMTHNVEPNETEHNARQRDLELDENLRQYFLLENAGNKQPTKAIVSEEEKRALQILQTRTLYRDERYETGLLWRMDDCQLPNSLPMATRRFLSLERRMEREPLLADALQAKIDDYKRKQYIREVAPEEHRQDSKRVWYLPVFPVENPNKPGKLRLVWDAAATVNGTGLNTMLLTGPDLVNPLISVLLKFREKPITVCGDIREMFHQVLIREEDQHSQRFLWRDRPGEEIKEYMMGVMTFGACSSPASAQYVMNLNANRFAEQYPAAVRAICQMTYVDDMLCSVETTEEAIQLAQSVRFIHQQGGFEIRNWTSNDSSVIAALNGQPHSEKDLNISPGLTTEKVLGMRWRTDKDFFTFRINRERIAKGLLEGRTPTKREVLSTMMTVFDPLGLLGNFLFYVKMLLQEVWRHGTGWDEAIPVQCNDKWQRWLALLPEMEKLEVPRQYAPGTSADQRESFELHTFVDASEEGMAAVVYMRTPIPEIAIGSQAMCTLVASKTRVAPLKYLSIPRMELQAATIGVRTALLVEQCLSSRPIRKVFWTDSSTVLAWIRADHRRYHPFVAARVGEILEATSEAEWRWVPTRENVADEATKWHTRTSLSHNDRWFTGPAFLTEPEQSWPIPKSSDVRLTTAEELRKVVNTHSTVAEPVVPFERFSSWHRLLRVTAFVLRAVDRLRRIRGQRAELESHELHRAEGTLLQRAQRDRFSEELAMLVKGKGRAIPRRSELYGLSPFLDDAGIIRMQSRARACKFITGAADPVILPRDHVVTQLILHSYHRKFLHQNHEAIMNAFKCRFLVKGLRRIYNSVRASCQQCKIWEASPRPPAMADLPEGRLAAFERPFTHTGIDFFGPMEVTVGRRVEKRWGVLLTCLTVRAVHLEVAHSLNTHSCIMAIRRFIAHRGTPAVFYSDRGTNFIGAERELRQTLKNIEPEVSKVFVSSTTKWQFNPPAAPHMGGSWERLVRSVKRALAALHLPRRPSDEELRSALAEIEGLLNARPLTQVALDDASQPALTPNHWLLGCPDGMRPWQLNDEISATRGWHLSQRLANHFWKRWVDEYLPEITRRSKWFHQTRPIQIGDIVLVVDPGLPRNRWPKGEVISVVNRDGQVRRVTVKTSTAIYERPAVNIAVLDVGTRAPE